MRPAASARLWLLAVIVTILPGMGLRDASAVVVTTTTGNTTAPADDFGFANVGKRGGLTAIYLGYQWVLTAAHVSAGTVQFNGVTYNPEAGTDVQLHNPPGMGLTDLTDLRLFRLTESPRLPALKISQTAPATGSEVSLVGQGYDRQDAMTAWDVGGSYPGSGTWTWTETDPPGDIRGFKLNTASRTIRWGTNRIEYAAYPNLLLGSVHVITLKTYFDEGAAATVFESQAVIGDSGGGMFYKRGSQWELSGILHAVSAYPNQPTATTMFGLTTYASDLSKYRDEILEIITPLRGDANLDNVVNDLDASILAANWQKSSGAIWEDGDFTGDGQVNDLDASVLARWWQATRQPAGSPLLAAVPEPAVATMLAGAAVAAVCWAACRRGRVSLG